MFRIVQYISLKTVIGDTNICGLDGIQQYGILESVCASLTLQNFYLTDLAPHDALFLLHRKQNIVCYIGQYSKHFDGIVFFAMLYRCHIGWR